MVVSPTERYEIRGVLGEAVKAFYAVLDRYTLEDLSRNRQTLGKVLLFTRIDRHGQDKPAR
jgi:DNA-binding IscR family transcriptional regulator